MISQVGCVPPLSLPVARVCWAPHVTSTVRLHEFLDQKKKSYVGHSNYVYNYDLIVEIMLSILGTLREAGRTLTKFIFALWYFVRRYGVKMATTNLLSHVFSSV